MTTRAEEIRDFLIEQNAVCHGQLLYWTYFKNGRAYLVADYKEDGVDIFTVLPGSTLNELKKEILADMVRHS